MNPIEYMISEEFVGGDELRDMTVPDTAPPAVNDWNHAVIVNSSFSDLKLSDSR